MSKFKCEDCGKENNIHKFTIKYVNNEKKFCYKNGEELRCECGSTKLTDINEPVDYSKVRIGTFQSMSIPDRQKILQKRSHAHFEKEIKERKHEMGKETIKKLLNR